MMRLILATDDRRPDMSDYPTVTLPPASPPPPPPAEVPRRRRGLWIALIAALATLVIAVPTVVYLLVRDDGQPATNAPAAPPAATAPGAVAPTAAPTPPGDERAVPAPDGRIPRARLVNATLVLPPWPKDNLTCQAGRVTFVDGIARMPENSSFFGRTITIGEVAYGDVDRDGARETVARIGCYIESGSTELVAFDRDAAGRIVTLGTVVASTGPVRAVRAPSIGSSGVVAAVVADYQGCCGEETPVQTQRRSYGWDGRRFVQVGGPTAFPPNPSVTETGGTASGMVFGDPGAGSKFATVKVTVSFLYGTRPDRLSIGFYFLPDDVHTVGPWPPVTPAEGLDGFTVDVPTPRIGTSVTYTFTFARPVPNTGGEVEWTVFGMTRENTRLSESNPYNGQGHLKLKG